jgi:hypothetical protein
MTVLLWFLLTIYSLSAIGSLMWLATEIPERQPRTRASLVCELIAELAMLAWVCILLWR